MMTLVPHLLHPRTFPRLIFCLVLLFCHDDGGGIVGLNKEAPVYWINSLLLPFVGVWVDRSIPSRSITLGDDDDDDDEDREEQEHHQFPHTRLSFILGSLLNPL